MDDLSHIAYDTYRSLVYDTPDFIDYFLQATPIEELGVLRLGS